jgi:hypothetical protein
MEIFKKLGLILLAPPVCILLYDLIYNWFVKNQFELEKLTFWWKKIWPSSLEPTKSFLSQVMSSTAVNKMFNLPACIVLFGPPLFFYLLYRIIFLLQGGKQGGYKSRY